MKAEAAEIPAQEAVFVQILYLASIQEHLLDAHTRISPVWRQVSLSSYVAETTPLFERKVPQQVLFGTCILIVGAVLNITLDIPRITVLAIIPCYPSHNLYHGLQVKPKV